MSPLLKTVVAVAAALTAIVMAIPLLLTMMMGTPGEAVHGFFRACAAHLGARATILANPPDQPPSPDQVLLRISQTATTLGFGRQGATVTAAIALRATGLANAANPASPETMHYPHSITIDTGAGTLGLPLTWASPAELMTPEVSAALALDRMVDLAPQWRDTDPAQLAAQITGDQTADFTEPAATATRRLADLPAHPPSSAASLTVTTTSPPATSTTRTTPPPATTAAVLDPAAASSVASTAPAAAACLDALTTPLPPIATGPNPYGRAIAEAAQHLTDTDPSTTHHDTTTTATPAANPAPTTSAQWVASVLSTTLATPIPDTIAAQLATGYTVDTAAAAGDAVYTDISADEGPHLAGIALDAQNMITLLPGHQAPQRILIGPSRVIRRIEGTSTR